MTKLGLTLNEAKTSLRNARQERFTFLGYSFGPHYPYNLRVRMHMSASPSKKSVQRLKAKVRELLVPGNNDPWPEVRDDLNRTLRGLVDLLQSRVACSSVPPRRSLRPRARARLPRQTAQGGRARQPPVYVR
jgi:hypothetical protein